MMLEDTVLNSSYIHIICIYTFIITYIHIHIHTLTLTHYNFDIVIECVFILRL